MLAALESGHNINSGTITTSRHSSTSEHYLGRAIDIITVNNSGAEKEALYGWLYENRKILCIDSLIHNFQGEVTCSREDENGNVTGTRRPTGIRPLGTTNMMSGVVGNQTTDCHDQHIHVSVSTSCGETQQQRSISH